MSQFDAITEDDVEQVKQWILQRRTRVQNMLGVADVKDPRYGGLCEDAECCDLLLDILDQFGASDLTVSALGLEDERYG